MFIMYHLASPLYPADLPWPWPVMRYRRDVLDEGNVHASVRQCSNGRFAAGPNTPNQDDDVLYAGSFCFLHNGLRDAGRGKWRCLL